jgi:phage terminase large subunit-like protein
LTHEDGSAFVLDPWQEEFVRELSLRSGAGLRRVYKEVLLGLPRGGGKTPLASGLALYELCSAPGRPKVFQAAGSKDQAAIGTGFARGWIEDGELRAWLKASARTITRKDGRGSYTVMGSDGRLGHGRRPNVGVIDELWLFKSAAEVQTYIAIQSALHKLPDSYLLAITTAGYDKTSLLGQKYERALTLPDIEHRREGFLTIARDRDAGSLMWWYGMPEGYDLDLADDEAVLRALRLANPGSWVDVHEMLRMLRRGMDERQWKRLCLNAWTSARDVWLPSGCWTQLQEPEGFEIPAGAPV